LILLNEQSLKDWAIKHQIPTPDDAHYLGQVLNGQIRAVVVYCGFFGKSCVWLLASTVHSQVSQSG
jgi:hypothetical protein